MSIYDCVSPTDTYVIYDQFGDFFDKNHLEVPVHGLEQAVEQYRFYKEFSPNRSIGLTTIELYNHKKESYRKK